MTLVADPLPFDLPLRPEPVWGTVASVAMHAAALALLAFLSVTAMPLEPPVLQSVAVDLISVAQFAAMVAPVPAPQTLAVPETATAVPVAPPAEPVQADGSIRATEFFSGSVLTDPANAALARGMPTMADGERAVQLCNIEAVEQIRRAEPDYEPDVVVPYAFAETSVRDGAIVADGAAFRSRREWYGLSFTCTPAPDFSAVTAFEFKLGKFIPHEEWEEHYLTAEEVGD
jgi:hypothetical protein